MRLTCQYHRVLPLIRGVMTPKPQMTTHRVLLLRFAEAGNRFLLPLSNTFSHIFTRKRAERARVPFLRKPEHASDPESRH
ncbi:hypothetical protein BJV77DRAFT_219891 [Russula vinacea]|nr:hypothetical protein BJV77DRAFT_219891 [Russula vinacea]